MRRVLPSIVGLVFMACSQSAPSARVFKIEHRSQLIGGPAAAGAVGDYLLENDKIRIIVHGRPEHTGDSVGFGGTIIDADIQRPRRDARAGGGRDHLFEIGPMMNLRVTKADPSSGFLILDPDEQGCPGLRVEGLADNVVNALELLGTLEPNLGKESLWIRTDYRICPGETFVSMTTDAFLKSALEGPIRDMDVVVGSRNLLGMILGDVEPSCEEDADCPDGETCDSVLFVGTLKACRGRDSLGVGAFGGWLTLMGAKPTTFLEGTGFEGWLNLKASLAKGSDVFKQPEPLNYFASVGDGVSYALYTAGSLAVPVATGEFSVSMSHEFHCPLSNPSCADDGGIRMVGYFAVGDGDAASAIAPFYKFREDRPTAQLSGTVIDARSGEVVSDADVFILRAPDAWSDWSDEEIHAASFEELARINRSETVGGALSLGAAGILTHLRTDTGLDVIRDGRFSGVIPLPQGLDKPGQRDRLVAVAVHGQRIGALRALRVAEGGEYTLVLTLPQPGKLTYQVRDHNNRSVPAKMTLGQCMPECARDADCGSGRTCETLSGRCLPIGGCTADHQCDPDEFCDVPLAACACRGELVEPIEVSGHFPTDGVVLTDRNMGGDKTIDVAPGHYEVIFSRGIEYSIDRQFVEVLRGREHRMVGSVHRQVDTRGFVSADFHIHSEGSPDSAVEIRERVASFAAEGVEFLSSSDHDNLRDFEPAIRELGLQHWMTSQVGIETSPLMLGHLLGFPVDYDATQPQRMPQETAYDWYLATPDELIESIRNMGTLHGEKDALVIFAHVYDYFNYYGLNPFTLNLGSTLFFTLGAEPLFNPDLFSGNFDGFEVLNGKSLDYVHRPTVRELRTYNEGLVALADRLRSGQLTYRDYSSEHMALGASTIASFLERTEAEQNAFYGTSTGVECACLGTDDCAADGAGDDEPCNDTTFRGVAEDWMRMMNRGVFKAAVANSDTHGLYHAEAGMPRNFVAYGSDIPRHVRPDDLDQAVRERRVVGSSGPFIRFTVNDEGVGGTVMSPPEGRVTLKIEVQSPTWFDVDRVQVFRNGELLKSFDACTEEGGECIEQPNTKVMNLNVSFDDEPGRDAWYAVSAAGLRGRHLAPVYSSLPLARLGFNETFAGLTGILGLEGGPARGPSVHPMMPWAMTNAIQVDLAGDGFDPPEGAPPDWAQR